MSEARLLTRDFGLLVCANFLQGLGYASMLLLPLYLQYLGASRTQIGAIMSTSAVSGLLTRPLVGWSLDRVGRKSTLVAGTILVVIAMAMVAAVDRIGPLIYADRVVLGIGLGTLFTGYFTFAADLVPVERRTEGLAIFGVFALIPMLVNPLSDRIGVTPPDLRWFLPLVGGLIAMSLFFLWPIREPRVAPRKGEPTPGLRDVLAAIGHRRLWPVWVATTAFASLVAIFMTFATAAAQDRGVDGPARLWFAYALGAVVVRVLGARLPDRLGPANLVAPATGLYVVAMLVLVEARNLDGFLLAAGLAGLGHGYAFPVLTSQAVSRTGDQLRGAAMATFTGLWQACQLVVAPSLGAVADARDDAFMFWVAAVGGTLLLSLWLGLEHRYGTLHAAPQT